MKIDWKHVLELAKKNAVSIIAVVVMFLSIGFVLFYIDGAFDELQEEVATRAGVQQELDSLRTQPRSDITLGPSAVNASLDGFPTPATIEAGKEVIGLVKSGAGRLLSETVEQNRLVPLRSNSYEAALEDWPMSGESNRSQRNLWVRSYRAYHAQSNQGEDLFNDETGSYPADSLPGRVAATRPPTAESVTAAKERLQASIEATASRDGSGDYLEPEKVEEEIQEGLASLERGLKYNRAADHLIYLSPEVLTLHEAASDQADVDAEGIFEAQMHLWVREQILFTLADINRRAIQTLPPEKANVVEAPVKQVVSLDIAQEFPGGAVVGTGGSVPTPPTGGGFGGGGRGGYPGAGPYGGGDPYGGDPFDPGNFAPPVPNAAPTPPPSDDPRGPRGPRSNRDEVTEEVEEGALTEVPVDASTSIESDYSRSLAGRPQHTPFFDAAEFDLTMRVEAAALPQVLQDLQQDAFVTIFNVEEIVSLDPVVALQEGYVFGSEPMVEVTVTGEMLFLREWTVPLMPEGIRLALAGG
jgi:hypothetical protein